MSASPAWILARADVLSRDDRDAAADRRAARARELRERAREFEAGEQVVMFNPYRESER